MMNNMRSEYIARSIQKSIGVAILMLILLSAIFLPPFEQKMILKFNRAKWDSQHVTHYRFKMKISCFCPLPRYMPVTIEVQDGQIVSMVDANGTALNQKDSSLSFERFKNFGTVEKLFDHIQEGIYKADKIIPTYDNQYAFPTSIRIDWSRNTDDEVTYTITNFEILP